MNLVINNIKDLSINNIIISKNKKNNIFNIYYLINLHIKLIGIPIKIKYNYINKSSYNNLLYIYILIFEIVN